MRALVRASRSGFEIGFVAVVKGEFDFD